MAQNHVTAERMIEAAADKIYGCLADYEHHHPNILPPAFSNFKVEEGGIGAGTVVSFQMTAGGRVRSYRMAVTEPEPGRILMEKDTVSSLETTFNVTPEGGQTRVTIDTRWNGKGGFGGMMEKLFAPPALRKLYVDELNRLDEYVRQMK